MIRVVKESMALQDVGDVDNQIALFAEDCTFMMPILPAPLRGRAALRKSVEMWPKAVTVAEWVAVDGNRLVAAWNWRGEGQPDDTPLLRGVSTFVFNVDGLIQEYEDWFDPDWPTRHEPAADSVSS
jgi:hypothetical protein